MKTRVLLTGATGFVGRQVLKSLSASGVSVDVVVREGSDLRSMAAYGVERVLHTADMFAEDVAWWKRACTDVDIVVHAAWYAEPGRYLQSPANLDCRKPGCLLQRALATRRDLLGGLSVLRCNLGCFAASGTTTSTTPESPPAGERLTGR